MSTAIKKLCVQSVRIEKMLKDMTSRQNDRENRSRQVPRALGVRKKSSGS